MTRDLVDALIQEELLAFGAGSVDSPPATVDGRDLRPGELWYWVGLRVGRLGFRARRAGALQRFRFARSPLWYEAPGHAPRRITAPDRLLEVLLASGRGAEDEGFPGAGRTLADLRSAVEHAAITARGWRRLGAPVPGVGGVHAGERLASTRDRPFHPTARASSGWTPTDHTVYGVMRPLPLAMRWVAVRRDLLRTGEGAGSDRLHEALLDAAGRERLARTMARAGAPPRDFQPLPVHPWQAARVLPTQFAGELAAGQVVVLPGREGRFFPTASLRTFLTVPEGAVHLKLPLGVSTLGAARLLPPRYLDNGDRAQRAMRALIAGDPELRRWVRVCDESVWSGWQLPSGEDEFEDRPGHLAAQLRSLPPDLLDAPGRLVLPMAALAAHEWDVLRAAFAALRPVSADRAEFALALFADLARAFCRMALSFLRYGVFPELHGQNVLVTFTASGTTGFVLRDHDALRLFPGWMSAAGVPDPGYRLRPGGAQSLSLPSAEALLGYLQTLGFQVNLYGIADALAAWSGADELRFWSALRAGVEDALAGLPLPGHVVELVEREVLGAATWPSRQVLGPLLREPPHGGVSMPAAVGRVPNPLTASGARR